MDYTTAAIICASLMLVLLLVGIPIAYALWGSSIIVGLIVFGMPALQKVGWTTYNYLFKFDWTPLPLFMLLACFIAQTAIGEDLYRAARNWSSRMPGGLIVGSILGEAAMAAALGASGPTILAVGKVAEPEFERYGYNKAFALGAMTCGGVLGPLIPPSATMIFFAVLGNVSLGRLFIAGVIPGIILAIMLSVATVIFCSIRPDLGPPAGKVSWRERFSSTRKIWPVVLVMVCILGSIYFGIATPTEAGGVGCFVILAIAIPFYGLRWKGIHKAMVEAAYLNAMLMIILIGAAYFAYVIGSSNLSEGLCSVVTSLNVPPVLVIIAIMLFQLILGCFIDGITILMLTLPIFLPVVLALGYDPLWFGILFVTNGEIGLITPPMGINLFLVRNAFNIKTVDLLKGLLPFIGVLIVFLALMVAFPQLSLWLPGMMRG